MKKYFVILTSTKLGISLLMKAGLLVFILPYISLSQIKIEERVEILPNESTIDSPSSGNEPIYTYTLTWSSNEYWRGTIQIVSCYGDTTDSGWTSSGYTTISIPGRGHHSFIFRMQQWYYHNNFGWGWYDALDENAEGKVFVYNNEIRKSNLLGTQVGTIDIPLLFAENFCESGYIKMLLQPTKYADCNEIGWFPTDALTLNIISGSEFVSFYNNRTGVESGNQVVIDPFVEWDDLFLFFGLEWDKDGLEDIILKIKDSLVIESLPLLVKVEANINEVIFTGEIEFYPNISIIEYAEFYPGEITTAEETSFSLYLSNYCEPLWHTKINLEIIQGLEYGSLIDPYTNERTKKITNLDHRYGFTSAKYVADGISPGETDTVIVKVSTTDPEIEPKEALLIIKPSQIYAYTEPEVLGANEEAEVIIKKRNPDGTLEDFPAEQTFELAVLDGCVNGNFMVNGEIGVYFADAMQPIKFVTADSIDTEFDKVLMRIGTDLGGSYRPIGGENGEEEKKRAEYESSIIGVNGKTIKELREGFEKMIAERKAEAEAKAEADAEVKEGGEPMFPVLSACAPNSSSYLTYYDFAASVQAGCTDAPKCNKPMEFPGIELIENINQDVCNNRTSLKSYFTPLLYNNAIRNSYIDVCFNSESGFWEFSFSNDNNLFVDCLLDICVSNINNMQEILIDDVHNFPNNWGCNRVKSDIRKHFTYGLAQPNSHTLRSILLAHENEHKKDFEVLLDRARSFHETALLSIRKPCEEFTDETAAQAYYLNLSNKIIINAYISAFDGFAELGGTPGSQKELDYEDRTNAKIYPNIIIDIYLAEVIYCQQL